MSATRRKGGRRRGPATEPENEERWLLTYADMITLLMALFMVLFSMSVVNQSKLESLSASLQEAFSGKILPGGKALQESGATDDKAMKPTPEPPIPAIQPVLAQREDKQTAAAERSEQEHLQKLKEEVDRYARKQGLQGQIQTHIAQRGLVIRLLTDKVLFDSGEAQLKPKARPVLGKVARIIRAEGSHPVMVEGHTDNVPIHGAQFPTNWELSTARAARVVRSLVEGGVRHGRLGASGYAWLHPISSNKTGAGRTRNRRVEIVLLRNKRAAAGGGELP